MTGHPTKDLFEAWLANLRIEKTRAYLERGRPFADRTLDALNAEWVETYKAARALEDSGREGELGDIKCEFDLRAIEPPMHLVAAEMELCVERFRKRMRETKPDPSEIEKLEEELESLEERLRAPKN